MGRRAAAGPSAAVNAFVVKALSPKKHLLPSIDDAAAPTV
jgi:hypothetical protein